MARPQRPRRITIGEASPSIPGCAPRIGMAGRNALRHPGRAKASRLAGKSPNSPPSPDKALGSLKQRGTFLCLPPSARLTTAILLQGHGTRGAPIFLVFRKNSQPRKGRGHPAVIGRKLITGFETHNNFGCGLMAAPIRST